jgi:hypothetical protein
VLVSFYHNPHHAGDGGTHGSSIPRPIVYSTIVIMAYLHGTTINVSMCALFIFASQITRFLIERIADVKACIMAELF